MRRQLLPACALAGLLAAPAAALATDLGHQRCRDVHHRCNGGLGGKGCGVVPIKRRAATSIISRKVALEPFSTSFTGCLRRRRPRSAARPPCRSASASSPSRPRSTRRRWPRVPCTGRRRGAGRAAGRPRRGLARLLDPLYRARRPHVVEQHGARAGAEHLRRRLRPPPHDAVRGGRQATHPVSRDDRSMASPARRRPRRNKRWRRALCISGLGRLATPPLAIHPSACEALSPLDPRGATGGSSGVPTRGLLSKDPSPAGDARSGRTKHDAGRCHRL